jgi:hypothetical protein
LAAFLEEDFGLMFSAALLLFLTLPCASVPLKFSSLYMALRRGDLSL